MSPSTSAPGFRRFLAGSIAALLAANAMAIATTLGHDERSPRPLREPATAAVESVEDPAAATGPVLVTTEDGASYLADPATEQGRAAIEDAARDGGEVHAITLPPGSAASSSSTDQLRTLLARLGAGTGGGTGTGSGRGGTTTAAPSSTTGSGSGDGGLLPIDTRLVEDLLRDPVTTVSSIVQSAPSTVSSLVQSTPSTLTSIVQSTPSTITSVVESTATTITSTVTTVLSTTQPVTGSVGTTVTSVAETVDQTVTTTLSTTCSLLNC